MRGRLYAKLEKPQPAVVMAHGFSETITMVADKYAEVLARAGFAVLLYDHAGFGRSGGEPRHVTNVWAQARGYQDALTFAATLDSVDKSRLAVWGDSLASGVVLVVAAVDDRVAAAVALVPVCGQNDPPPDPDDELYAALRKTLRGGDISCGGTSYGPMPVVVQSVVSAAVADAVDGVSVVHRVWGRSWHRLGERRDVRGAEHPGALQCRLGGSKRVLG